jgi:general secretion pathway protein M
MASPHPLIARWTALAPRERLGLTLAATVVGIAVVWAVLLAPALRTLKSAGPQAAVLAGELDRMQAMQARARALQAQPAVAPQEALKSLQTAAAGLGKSATLQVIGDQATLTLKQLPAPALAQWLNPTTGLGLSPADAQLQRDASTAQALWNGTLIYRLPAGAGTP